YLSINHSVVSYYSADSSAARHWANLAIESTAISGHSAGRRAALTNLGHIEFSGGQFQRAENYFQQALELCERGSTYYLAVLDGLAQAKLRAGQLDDCQRIIQEFQNTTTPEIGLNAKAYVAWASQTRLQLLLKQGHLAAARQLAAHIHTELNTTSDVRLRT